MRNHLASQLMEKHQQTQNFEPKAKVRGISLVLRVQVSNYHIPTQDVYYNYCFPNPKYLVIGYMDPLGKA